MKNMFKYFFSTKNQSTRLKCEVSPPGTSSNPDGNTEEMAGDLTPVSSNTDLAYCAGRGVTLHMIPGMLKLTYDGLLAKSGAQEVYAVITNSDGLGQRYTQDYPMNKTSMETFELLTPKQKQGDLSIAFRDSAGNWDNNSGRNYVFFETVQ